MTSEVGGGPCWRQSRAMLSKASGEHIRERRQIRRAHFFYVSCLLAIVYLIQAFATVEAATTNTRPKTSAVIPTNNNQGPKTRPGTVMHPAFAQAGRTPGLEIWRIENFEPVAYPKNDYGKFYTGDSYIILFTKQTKDKLSWDIHFWLGTQTSQDESGAAAILTVELDDQLGGAPVQHREIQEHESQLFLSHFKGGIRYLPGGIASGFTHVDPDAFEKRLFQVKGKRNVRVRQVEPSVSSMNKGDCFILDVKRDVYVYVGNKAKRAERLKAITAANQIRDQDHGGRSKVHIIDEFSNEDEVTKYFEALGTGNRNAVPDESTSEDDEVYENTAEKVSLYRVSDASGSTKYDKINEKPLKQSSLDTNDCFILDTGASGLYAWIGKKCSNKERQDVMKKAQEFITTNKYPAWTRVQRIVESGEPSDFKQYFPGWRDRGELHSRILRSIVSSDEVDDDKLRKLDKSGGKAPAFMPDEGQGQIEIYRIENFEMVPLETELYGMFFGGDSYVIKYTYHDSDGIEKYIIYYWQGKESTADEKAASAIQAVKLDNDLGGKALQVRVTQDHEPKHFLRIFQGKMIILMGGKASGFKNMHDHDTYDVDGTRLFRIRGTSLEDVRATQLPEVASSLNSDDVFILETPNATYIWNGNGSNEEERSMALDAVARVSPDIEPVILNEGEESPEFWDALGGQDDYKKQYDEDFITVADPHLYHCQLLSSGKLRTEEIKHFTQDDLVDDDIMILDSGDEIYVWVGNESSEDEKKAVLRLARDYLKNNPASRNHEQDVIITIKQGEEPDSFKSFFSTWDPEMWQSQPTYEDLKNQIEENNKAIDEE